MDIVDLTIEEGEYWRGGGAKGVLPLPVSGVIGLFFGVVPAKRAASLDPIVALRSV